MIPRHLQIALAFLLLAVLLAGGYMLELRRREQAKTQATAGITRALPAPTAGPAEVVKLVVAYDEDGLLVPKEANVALPAEPADRAREILRTLLALYAEHPSPHPIKEDADVKTVFLVSGPTGDLCVVDLNAAFVGGHRSGILVEQLTLASMVETLSVNFPRVQRVKFLVEGQERETLAGHADLSTTYEVPKVHNFVLSLQNLELPTKEPVAPAKDAAKPAGAK
ncbi:MAG TPA: GerMN domain-containing protein [Terriglobales bacterium]|nr:GerMN domain-containing protein [Terriglobales bacterium]